MATKWPATSDGVRLTPSPSPQRAPKLQRPCVFLVEGDVLTKQALVDMLEARFEVRGFASGEEALLALAQQRPDAVLLASSLPGLDGIEVCRRMKQHLADLPIGLITLAERTDALDAGIDDFLLKPLNRLEVRTRVGNLVKLAYFQREQHAAKSRLEALQAQLEHAERLATLGTFASGVGHELNNVNSVLSTLFDELRRTRTVDDDLLADLSSATGKLKDLATAVQHLSAPSQCEAMVDVREVIKNVLWITRLTGRTKYVAVDFTPPSSPAFVRLVAAELQQVVLNLVTNAADALNSARAGRITIDLTCLSGVIQLRVADNGPGFSVEARAHVFDPHFSTKTVGLATGLGLAMVRQLVSAWGGSVDIATHPGAGTAVDVRIPFDRALTPS